MTLLAPIMVRSHELYTMEPKLLESGAHHCYERKDSRSMIKFVRAFNSMESKLVFLRSLSLFNVFLFLEDELGNFGEAADVAKMIGDILLDADLLAKACKFHQACERILEAYVRIHFFAFTKVFVPGNELITSKISGILPKIPVMLENKNKMGMVLSLVEEEQQCFSTSMQLCSTMWQLSSAFEQLSSTLTVTDLKNQRPVIDDLLKNQLLGFGDLLKKQHPVIGELCKKFLSGQAKVSHILDQLNAPEESKRHNVQELSSQRQFRTGKYQGEWQREEKQF
ncbi:hypothetical protein PIB30_053968 [Stylosanthes scabra]|uniref:Uncharacterized protein n=1 Tax=Stylosanthes scabra TaxID=79078 RepID=A0ABU6YG36_9FABA|nr:hypothetical protein [Stylosanthes scabra]